MAKAAPEDRDAREGETEGASRWHGRRGGMQSPTEALQPLRPPPPPVRQKRRPRHPIVSTVSGVLSFLLVLAAGTLVALSYGEHVFTSPGPLDGDKIVFIQRGSGTAEIIDRLEQQGVIENGLLFSGELFLHGKRRDIKAGEYLFKAHVSAYDVMNTLVEGKSIQHTVTLPEGLTSEQIVQRLKDQELLTGDAHIPQEGTLMPDTVKFTRGDSRESIIKYMQTEQRKVLAEIWKNRAPDLPLKSAAELVTLASIVEKETGKPEERPRVAGVFINRLLRHMKLQSDPTIIYGLVGGKGTLGRPISASEVKEATPYNTYAIEGLPPGPICNPGRAAMEAVANPLKTKELYFVADGTGGHAFAETLDEHMKNVARWRQIEKDTKDKAPPDAEKPVPPGRQRTEIDLLPPEVRMAQAEEEVTSSIPTPAPLPAKVEPAPPQELTIGNFKLKVGPEIDQMGWTMPGTDLGADRALAELNAADDALPVSSGPVASYPVKPAMLADMRARALRWGLDPGNSTTLPPDLAAGPGNTATRRAPCRTAQATVPFKPRAFDASEGTALDPLRNKTFDLNSPKTVPIVVASLSGIDGLMAASSQKRPASERASIEMGDCASRPQVAAANSDVKVASVESSSDAASERPHGFDASEGTKIDPLRNKTFDLNSPQTVPAKPLTFMDPVGSSPPLPAPRPASTPASSVAPAAAAPSGKARGFDASEGTALDPLRNKSFDLNSPQTVPTRPITMTDPSAVARPIRPAAPAPAASAPPAPTQTASLPPPDAVPEPPPRPRLFDAAERKRADGELDRTFDLNSPQKVLPEARVVARPQASQQPGSVPNSTLAKTSAADRAPVAPQLPVRSAALPPAAASDASAALASEGEPPRIGRESRGIAHAPRPKPAETPTAALDSSPKAPPAAAAAAPSIQPASASSASAAALASPAKASSSPDSMGSPPLQSDFKIEPPRSSNRDNAGSVAAVQRPTGRGRMDIDKNFDLNSAKVIPDL